MNLVILICIIIIMSRIKEWMQKQIAKPKTNPLWRLFLSGVKGQMQAKNPKPYNFYIKILSVSATIGVAYYFLLFRKNQMDVSGHNILVPQYVYNVRQESYVYWQTVRIAKGMPTLFTYYKWDDNLMFEIDRTGKQTPIQTHKGIQNVNTFQSPLHEYNFPASAQTHSRIVMYLKNINNPYNLHNYLRFKPITIGDWLRTGYFMIYRQLGLSNRWRYDQFVRKPDIYYRWEKIRLAFRLNRNRQQLYQTIDQLLKQITFDDCLTFFVWFL